MVIAQIQFEAVLLGLDLISRLIECTVLLMTCTVLRGFLLLLRAAGAEDVLDRLSSDQLYTLVFGAPGGDE